MIILKGPYPVFTKTVVLPNPKLGDSYTPVRELNVKRSINGTLHSYVTTTTAIRLLYEIDLTRQKSLELEDFYKLVVGGRFELLDFNSIRYLATFVNSFEKMSFRKSWYKPSDPLGSEEAVTVSLEIEVTPL